MTKRLLFLPGAEGAAAFWEPVGKVLPSSWPKVYLSWPGLAGEPARAGVNTFDDFVRLAERELEPDSVLVAHSMGGVVAITAALRNPETVTGLVLVGTAGGVDMRLLGGAEWRPSYREAFPAAPSWITEEHHFRSDDLRDVSQPTLLIWGDADPISPVAVGEHLSRRLGNARLSVIAGAAHDLAVTHASAVGALIEAHVELLGPPRDLHQS